MRVLVVGASGLLGRALVKAFAGAGHEVQGTALERAQKGNHLVLDVFKNEQVGVPHHRQRKTASQNLHSLRDWRHCPSGPDKSHMLAGGKGPCFQQAGRRRVRGRGVSCLCHRAVRGR